MEKVLKLIIDDVYNRETLAAKEEALANK